MTTVAGASGDSDDATAPGATVGDGAAEGVKVWNAHQPRAAGCNHFVGTGGFSIA